MYQQLSLSMITIVLLLVSVNNVSGYLFTFGDGVSLDHHIEKRWEILHFVNRSEWKALPTTEPPKQLNTPVPYIMIYHTGNDTCFYRKSCDKLVRSLQAKYISTYPWDNDIGYNFLISGDGKVYVGCGWERAGAHTIGIDTKSIGIALIGTFFDTSPSTDQYYALSNLIKFGITYGYISKQFNYYSEPDMNINIDSQHKISDILQVIRNSIQ